MYLEMQLMNDIPLVNDPAESASDCQYRDLAAARDAPAAAEHERERLIALLQCAYSWSRLQAQQEVIRWLAIEAGVAASSRSAANP